MRAHEPRRSERGATAVVVAILAAVLAGFLMLVLNTGHVMAVRGQLQNATDSAALAGAQELNGTLPGLDAARAAAVDFASRHGTDRGMPVTIDPGADVVFGNWNRDLPRDAAFTPITSTTPNALKMTNAVLVRAGREAARGNSVDVVAGGLLGTEETDVRAQSMAVRGGSCEEGCAVPLAFAECLIVNPDGSLNCGTELVFNSDTTDNIGFTNLASDSAVSTDVLRDILRGSCKKVAVGDAISIGNGAQLSPLVGDFQALIGKQVSAPIVRLPSGCPAKFEEAGGEAIVVGFATFTITNVTGGATKAIYIRLDCTEIAPEPVSPGCDFFGTAALRPRLVR
jgi:Flp pilus assembly protein TadG